MVFLKDLGEFWLYIVFIKYYDLSIRCYCNVFRDLIVFWLLCVVFWSLVFLFEELIFGKYKI